VTRLLKHHLLLTALAAILVSAGPASAQIDLRFTPPDTTMEPGASTRVSVMLDDAVFFRTIELTVTYDSTLIGTVDAGPGELFNNSGFFIWDGFEEDVPGTWHGFAIVMGATDSLSGPGELFYWQVEGLVEGTTNITATQALLYEPNALIIPDVTLAPTTLRVRWAPTGVDDVPALQTGLKLYPNPFNPRTQVAFDLPAADRFSLAVFDARGRRVATLHEGVSSGGPLLFDWDGRDDTGMAQPGGVYLFRLETEGNGVARTATTKGILLK